MEKKKFYRSSEEIRPLARGYGGCIASDRIIVDGMEVGHMSRNEPVDGQDSGWEFLAGDETQEYMDNSDNFGVYDVNTIANYDPGIIPLLKSPVGSAFAFDEEREEFVSVPSEEAD